MKPYSIYSVKNKVNGKVYVGMTTNLKSRWMFHKSNLSNKTLLTQDIRNLGCEHFEFSHIMDCFTKHDAAAVEAQLILELKAKYPDGYNMTDGGLGSKGRVNYYGYTRNRHIIKGRPDQSGELNHCYGKFGDKHPATKNVFIAKNLTTGEQTILVGSKAIIEAGFNPSAVYTIAKKKSKRTMHHNHTFELAGA
jgi:group I intron endonuclease